ncbi:MAG: hypothetical protein QXM27_02805 [Candidatus Pacearchaeota archaeon]
MEKTFIIDPTKIAKKLIKEIEKNKKLNVIQKTLLKQIIIQNPFFISEYEIKAIIPLDKYTLRFHSRLQGKIKNIDIKYNPIPDLYEIRAYKLKDRLEKIGDKIIKIPNIDEEEIYKNEYVYFDELEKIIREIVYR